jgi:hypothetical protein
MRTWNRIAATCGALLLAVGLGAGPASADPRSTSITWTDQNGNTCTMYGAVGAHSTDGYVLVTSRVQCSKAGKDGTLNITAAKGPSGAETGSSTPWCSQACSHTVKIPYTGPGTYSATVYYWDDWYVIEHGHDPRLLLASAVTR